MSAGKRDIKLHPSWAKENPTGRTAGWETPAYAAGHLSGKRHDGITS